MSKPKPYRPSNGTEGEWFHSRFCYQCRRDAFDNCGIHTRMLALDVEDKDYPSELTYDAEGRPTCTAFDDKSIPHERHAPRCKHTEDLFK